jgi:hypothetical protein
MSPFAAPEAAAEGGRGLAATDDAGGAGTLADGAGAGAAELFEQPRVPPVAAPIPRSHASATVPAREERGDLPAGVVLMVRRITHMGWVRIGFPSTRRSSKVFRALSSLQWVGQPMPSPAEPAFGEKGIEA